MLRLIAIDARALARRVTAAGESVPEIAPVVV